MGEVSSDVPSHGKLEELPEALKWLPLAAGQDIEKHGKRSTYAMGTGY